jgi:hypothetical protein
VSDPASAQYAKYLPTDEITEIGTHTPSHSNPAFLCAHEASALFFCHAVSPSAAALKTVMSWIHEQGATNVGMPPLFCTTLCATRHMTLPCAELSRNRDAITMNMPVHKVEAAFGVSLRRFVSPGGTRHRSRLLPSHPAKL